MTDKMFLDINIMVYAYDDQFPLKQRQACNLLDELISCGQAVISTQVLAEFYVVTTRRIANPLQPIEALRCIDHYTQCIEIAPVTAAVVREAIRATQAYNMSFWDAQIWATAHLNQISIILSEDIPGTKTIEGIRYHNPFSI